MLNAVLPLLMNNSTPVRSSIHGHVPHILGYCSSLYPAQTRFLDAYYASNRRDPRSGFYSDHLIHSPGVVVFREDAGLDLLPSPFLVDVITCPAVNKGRAGRDVKGEELDRRVKEVSCRARIFILNVKMKQVFAYSLDI